MCERIKDSRTVTGLYGESNQITWGLDDTERYVTEPDQPVAGVTYFETLAGDCAFGGADTVRSRVYFTCDREAIDKVEVAVIYESYYSCTVFVEMKTALACSDIGERMPSLPLRSFFPFRFSLLFPRDVRVVRIFTHHHGESSCSSLALSFCLDGLLKLILMV